MGILDLFLILKEKHLMFTCYRIFVADFWVILGMHARLCLTLYDSMDYSPPGSLSMGFSRQEFLELVAIFPSRDLSNPENEPMSVESPALQSDSSPLCDLGLFWYISFIRFRSSFSSQFSVGSLYEDGLVFYKISKSQVPLCSFPLI